MHNNQKDKPGHIEIINTIIDKLDDNFLDVKKIIENQLKNISWQRYNEKKLKIAIITFLLEKIDSWVQQSYNIPILSEFSLPADTFNIEGLDIKSFNWLQDPKLFLPPIDIVISPTGWIPDPFFGYSIMIGIELKILRTRKNNDLNRAKQDIKKLLSFLRWQDAKFKQCLNTKDSKLTTDKQKEFWQHVYKIPEKFTMKSYLFILSDINNLSDELGQDPYSDEFGR